MNKCCINLFVKDPEEIKVKTRLSANLNSNLVAELYKSFIFDILRTLDDVDSDIFLFCYPEESSDKFRKWYGGKFSYDKQKGRGLGERMKNSFLQGFNRNYKKVIAIGSDSPDLPADILSEAVRALGGYEAVLGPADDGGYYLIGFSSEGFIQDIFKGIKWSTNRVLSKTRDILKAKKIYFKELVKWEDIDTLKDLKKYYENNKESDFRDSATFRFIEKNRIFESEK